MGGTEFANQITKYETRIKKHTAISHITTCLKLLLGLAVTTFLGLSIYNILNGGLRAKTVIACLMSGAALFAVCLYHEKVREKIKHSHDMIAVNRKHFERISSIETDAALLQPYITDEESVRQQTVVTSMNRDTGFSNYYVNAIQKGDPGATKRKPAIEPDDDELFAKATAIKFLLM